VLLPADLPSGDYVLLVGWYPADGGDRLPVRNAGGEMLGTELTLGTIRVLPRPP
jgi:hypothetical protein